MTQPTVSLAAIRPAPGAGSPLTSPDDAAGAPGAAGPAGPASAVDLRATVEAAGVDRHPATAGGPWVAPDPTAPAAAGPGGRPAGPLEHTVVAVKDLIAVAGLPLGAGSRTRTDAPPEPRDATIVARLRAAGAVIAGTAALHELAFGVTGVNDETGYPAHPHDRSRVPGGSSSGSAVAIALGHADLALGTDTGGSVRIPAALCGVTGFKPSRGRYALDGILPLAPTLDHPGLLARHVNHVAAGHHALTGEPVPPAGPASGLRLGVNRAALLAAHHTVATALDTALRTLSDAGCELVDIDWPDRSEVLDVSTTILFAEAAAVHRDLLTTAGADLLGTDVHDRLRTGASIDTSQHRDACAEAATIEDDVRATLTTVDAVLGPTVPVPAPTIDTIGTDQTLPRRLVANTRLANITGVPALTLPVPTPQSSLPVGLQITGLADAHTLATATAIATAIHRPERPGA